MRDMVLTAEEIYDIIENVFNKTVQRRNKLRNYPGSMHNFNQLQKANGATDILLYTLNKITAANCAKTGDTQAVKELKEDRQTFCKKQKDMIL